MGFARAVHEPTFTLKMCLKPQLLLFKFLASFHTMVLVFDAKGKHGVHDHEVHFWLLHANFVLYYSFRKRSTQQYLY